MGLELQVVMASGFEFIMQAIWLVSLSLLLGAFKLADQFSVFSVDTRTGPIAVLWPMMLWISGVIALGLFFWQLIVTNLRGGRGFMRLVGGPVQYGIALAVTVSTLAVFLAGVDGLTNGILEYGLQSKNFSDALKQTSFGDGIVDGVKGVALGICAFVGVIPAAVGYILEMLFREAAITVLVATIPVTAAGLLANITASWFWRTCRWLLACVAMKPVLALALVLGVAISGGSEGLSGLLAGIGVLLISLFCPFVLFKLFAFVDPNSDTGAAFRDALSGAGVDSYGANNPAMLAGKAALGGGGGGGSAIEDANTGRFDAAVGDEAEGSADDSGGNQSNEDGQGTGGSSTSGSHSPSGGSDTGGAGTSNGSGTSGGSNSATEGGADGGGDSGSDGRGSTVPPAANLGQVVSSSPDRGPSGSYDNDSTVGDKENGAGGSTSGTPKSGGSGGGGTAAGAEEAAVIL
ncbi:hypothetical protein [Umezawaea sp. Da 62-37]|uniref:hypothetical protein n=1 Tax=Umezawaea sp. Da 62-37 TaxID=3075927 RepID=UPI0028F6C9A2|nr:hypothetical protein [Umezawaea sp. Da 62-37]WNV83162.1 hypothetical protein RM788_33930 [Umezawaea sp. Da 62-37]